MSRTITALEPQKRDQERVNVYLDGEFVFGLPLIDATKLRVGQTLSDDEIAALRDIDAVARAVDRAVHLLARRPYSTAELRRYLLSKEIAPPVVDETLDRLEHLGYVDDQAFTRFWIEDRMRFRPRGLRALRYELRQKGIAPAIIEAALAEVDPGEAAHQAAQERITRLRGQSRRDVRTALGAFLVRRGFSYDVARDAVERTLTELEEHEPEYFLNDQNTDNGLEDPYEE
ncbi:MAG TPA: RecX family transcriptional regulator [Aggregatilinea sp.]|uniref:regulatory protein RecX n=1 Tax=Aggregatilinea sp. TaxID=2806333 RepID=UPI002BEFE2B7|nr:RecX family transcriptional regulator [Aggregatilinea sp.]HML21566.1 RecX family transcriptional regulator [Aggregatilinea sp.]